MRICIQSKRISISIPIPLITAKATVKYAISRSVKQSKVENKKQANTEENELKDNHPSKREIDEFLSASVKLLKDYRRENGKFVLVEVYSDDGESIIITV